MFLSYELEWKTISFLLLLMQVASLALNKIQSELNLHKLESKESSTELHESFQKCNHY